MKRRKDKKEGEEREEEELEGRRGRGEKKEGEEREGRRGGGSDRRTTCPSMGDVDDAEDSLAPAGGQGHTGPCLQEDGAGASCGPQEPVQVGGLPVREEGQVQGVARHLQPGVKAQGRGDCRKQETGPPEQELVALEPSPPPPSSEAHLSSLLPHPTLIVLFCPWRSVAAAVQPGRPYLSVGTTQGSFLTQDFALHQKGNFPCPPVFRALLLVSLTIPVPSVGPVICCDTWHFLSPRGAAGLGPAGRDCSRQRGKNREGFVHLGLLVSKFPAFLTRW